MYSKRSKILIIDDTSTSRMLVGTLLRDLGFSDITEADDGDEAWKALNEAAATPKPYGLVISDWNMPRMQGIDLLTKIRATPLLAATPFIMLTADADRDHIALAMKAGVTGYLLKPFSKEQLQNTLTLSYTKAKKAG